MESVVIDEFDFISGDGYRHGMIHDVCKKINPSDVPKIMEQNYSIYHYTSTEGLKNILMEKKLWFTHIQYLNDCEEVNVGMDIFNRRNEEIIDIARIINPDIPISSDDTSDTSNLHAFVCCFSLENDLLPMWNYYTKDTFNKGYNIGFDYRKLITSLIVKNPELECCDFSCGKVNYCWENVTDSKEGIKMSGEGNNYVDAVTEYANIRLSKLDMNILNLSKKQKEDLQNRIKKIDSKLNVLKLRGKEGRFDICHTMEVVFYMKKICFKHENEFRIVITVPDNKFREIEKSPLYGFRNSNGILTPYLELAFDEKALLGITASPTNNGDLVDKSIDEYCKFCGIDKSLPEGITHSKIPVRF